MRALESTKPADAGRATVAGVALGGEDEFLAIVTRTT